MSARQPGNPSLEQTLLFSDLAVKAAKSENKEGFSTSEKIQISSRVNKFYWHGRRGNSKFAFLLSY